MLLDSCNPGVLGGPTSSPGSFPRRLVLTVSTWALRENLRAPLAWGC